jgi:hypothetical protein
MEPRNIGVFVWAQGTVAVRFLRDGEAKFINDPKTYLRWREFWRDQMSGDEIHPLRGEPIPKSSPDFVDGLLSTQNGNYVLVDGGSLLSNLSGVEVDEAADFLFDQLVAEHHQRPEFQDHENLASLSDRLMTESGLSDRLDYHERYPLNVLLFGVPQDIFFDYGLGGVDPLCVYQRVSLRGSLHTARSTALSFSALKASKRVTRKSQCCSLIDSTEPYANTSAVEMLEQVGEVADMADMATAIKKVRDIAERAESR